MAEIQTTIYKTHVRIRPQWWRHPIFWFRWKRWDRKIRKMREDPVLAKAMDDHAADIERRFLFGDPPISAAPGEAVPVKFTHKPPESDRG